jgi:hypothetical protein
MFTAICNTGVKGDLEMITRRANEIRRLNFLLKLPSVPVKELDATSWTAFQRDLCSAVLSSRRANEVGEPFSVTLTDIRMVKAELGSFLRSLFNAIKNPDDARQGLQLEGQHVRVEPDGNKFAVLYMSEDVPTRIYQALCNLIEQTEVAPRDILVCANPKCETFFVPLRKPHPGENNFCSPKCSNLIAARNWRKKQSEALREKEKERSHKKYKARMEKRGLRVGARRPRR